MINAIRFYRMANGFWRWHVPLLPRIIKLLMFLLYNSDIPYECSIGGGSFFGYAGIGVVIHGRARIGRNVAISPGVTVGGRSGSTGVPRIGNNVYLGAGAKIIGDIELGDYVIVGANAVVLNSVPSQTVVAGVPARIIKSGLTQEEFLRLT